MSTSAGFAYNVAMAKRRIPTLWLLFLTVLSVPAFGAGPANGAASGPATAAGARYAQLPMRFEVNEGQTDGRVKYLARGLGYTVFLTGEEAVLALRPGVGGEKAAVVRMRLLGGASGARVRGEKELAGRSHYFIGKDPKGWRREIATYERVRYEGVYEGVDVVYHGRQGRLEYDLEVEAGAGTEGIRLGLEGVESLRVDEAGDLVVGLGDGEVKFQRPEAYQWEGGKKREVAARYELAGKREVRFKVGEYDRRKELIIDPVLSYSTYLGGSGGDVAYAIATDASGYAYVAGITNSSDFPKTGATFGSGFTNGEAFIAKLDTDGTSLVYSTYIGGTGSDTAAGLAVSAGEAYLTGTTTSTNFPTTASAFQTSNRGNGDAFVVHLNGAGNQLVYSTFLGGGSADFGQAIVVDSSGNASVTGSTQSSDFPLMNALQPTMHGGSDVFVSKLNFTGDGLVYSTYLGGLQADVGQSIAADGSGNVYVSGYTFSSDFPLQNPYQGGTSGSPDAFVAELDAAGSALILSTYLGGSADDRAMGIALDSTGNIYVAGVTRSSDFPTTVAALQTLHHGERDAFITKLVPTGTNLVYSTFLGGTGADQANAIVVDASGNAFVTGFTQSSDFPTQNPVQTLLGISGGSFCGASPCSDAFVSQLNSAGGALNYSTYLGGSGADFGQAIRLGSTGIPYVAGSTASSNFPAIAGAYQASLRSVAGNGFVAKIDPANAAGIAIVPDSLSFGNQGLSVRSAEKSVTIINAGSASLTVSDISATGDFQQTNNCIGTISGGGGYCTINVTYTPSDLGTDTEEITITDSGSGSPHSVSVTGTGVAATTAVTLSPKTLAFEELLVGSVSAPQTATITNSGTSVLEINNITVTGDYQQTNTCGDTFNVLQVGDSCTVSVTFQPVGSGARNGAVSIFSNASGSPHVITLTGTGMAVFSISSPNRTNTVTVGTTSTTFTIGATAPDSFSGNITLSCSSGVTCSFDPTAIFSGQTSTLTVSDLSGSTSNPLNFTVRGTSGAQSATVSLTIIMADYSLSVSPALNTIIAGQPAEYTVVVTPLNGFNQEVTLGCDGLPRQAQCEFSQKSVTPGGSPVTIELTVRTVKNTAVTPPWGPLGGNRLPLVVWPLLVAPVWLLLRRWNRGRTDAPAGLRSPLLALRLALIGLGLAFLLTMGGCRGTTVVGGTPTGNYTITVKGTLNSNTAVQRTTSFNLAVT